MTCLLKETMAAIRPIHRDILEKAKERIRNQAKPAGSLGMLEDLGARLAAIRGTLDVWLRRRVVVTCAGDHGVVEEGVSQFPQEVTPKMVYNFVGGGASINALARAVNAEVYVADLGVNYDFEPNLPIFHFKIRKGTWNIARGPAMTREEAIASIEAGIRIVEQIRMHPEQGELDILATGDMGIGNTTPSTAIIAAFSRLPVPQITGRGTGIDDEGLKRKISAIERALNVNQPNTQDPLDVLAKVGGFEIGGLAGLVLGAARYQIPVVCDGLISTAGALIACELVPIAKEYLFCSHRSVEVGHRYMHERLGLDPILDLRMRLGEGTGAVLAIPILHAAARGLAEIKTFQEVAIEDKNR